MHLHSFQIFGFKNFGAPVALDGLGRVNVIHGDNNVGKSNLVEAVGFFFALLEEYFEVPPLATSTARSLERTSRTMQAYLSAAEKQAGGALGQSRVLSFQHLEGMGYPALDIFHRTSSEVVGGKRAPLPIKMEAVLAFSHASALEAGVVSDQDADAVERVRVALRLTRAGQECDLSLERFEALGRDDATTPRSLSPTRRWGTFLTRRPALGANGHLPRFALTHASRALAGEREPGPTRDPRDQIPSALAGALWEAKESTEPAQRRVYERFREAVSRFDELTGPGQVTAVYDRRTDRASLVFDRVDGDRIPMRLLGAGVQQMIGLIGRVVLNSGAILALEEPELNLRYTRQLELRDAFEKLVGSDGGPAQLLLTSHSPAFESGTEFYALSAGDDGPVIERRSVDEASRFTQHELMAAPAGAHAPLCYVSSEGLVQVPEDVLAMLGLQGGGGVIFIARKDTGHVEMLTDEQFDEILSSPVDGDDSESGDGA
ncbi:AAA family ATPase [Haliangium sp.]|uniref:AAA family ATPase n=1 Tax=Haliangium sp. TaxID=2663208 RepID=UPI003D09EB38